MFFTSQKQRKWLPLPALQYGLVLLGAFAVYAATCAPTILWQDSGLFVYRILHNDLQGNLGIALSHPLYILIGMVAKLIPVGELAWRVNMISAVFGSIAVANLFLLMRLWLGRSWPALVGAVSLAVSWTFWQHAVIAEVYTLYAAQLFTELLVLLQYVRTRRVGWLCLLGFLNGLSVANHLWGLMPLACYGVYLLALLFGKRIRIQCVVLFVFLWMLGAAPYEYLVIHDAVAGGSIGETIKSALFGRSWQNSVLNCGISLKSTLENMIFFMLNFPTPNMLLVCIGAAVIFRKSPAASFAGVIVAMLTLFLLFAFRYKVVDRHAFFLPFYCLVAVLLALGADWVLGRSRTVKFSVVLLVLAILPSLVYAIIPDIARKYYPALGERRQRPYRDEYTYWLQPWKTGCDGAERFAVEVLRDIEDNAVLYAGTTDVHPLLYVQQVKGIRDTVMVVSDYDHTVNAPDFNAETLPALLEARPVYVVSIRKGYRPGFLDEGYIFTRQGLLHRVWNANGTKHAPGCL